MSGDRLARALSAIDAANREDPNRDRENGTEYPKELLYGMRMSLWLSRLRSQPTEAQQLAARGQHICRWKVPRTDYEATREGYLRWRSHLYRYHADQVGDILRASGYDESTIADVKRMVSKQGIKRDADVQLIEDVACLVFLEYYFPAFAEGQSAEKVLDIVRKTWRKMSDAAHQAALKIDYPDALKPLLEAALAPGSQSPQI